MDIEINFDLYLEYISQYFGNCKICCIRRLLSVSEPVSDPFDILYVNIKYVQFTFQYVLMDFDIHPHLDILCLSMSRCTVI